jgi:GT2 family glycosyltransferase
MSKIGLVTVLYKSDEVLEGFFKSISGQTYKNYILYLIDNSVNDSTNSLINGLVKDFPVTQYNHIKNANNIGVAGGNNLGVKLAFTDGCDYVLLLNNDIEIEQDFVFEKLINLCLHEKKTMVVPKIYYYGGKRIWMAGGYFDRWRALGVHFGYNEKDKPKYEIARYVSYAPTCFMIIAKKVFDQIGYIDEKYFAYYDDVDFVLRASQNGFYVYYEPSIYILHKVSSLAGPASPFYVYYSNRNKIYFIRKNIIGFRRYFAIGYTLLSRIAFYIRYNSVKRKKLIAGLKDGFKLSLEKNKY